MVSQSSVKRICQCSVAHLVQNNTTFAEAHQDKI